jgi:hypothetical protein
MLATGGLLVSIALLTLAVIAPVFRSSNPPQWTTRGWIGELITLAIVCTLALGLGYLGAGAIDAFRTGPDYLDLSLLVVVLFALVVVWRGLKARAGPNAVGADASAFARALQSGRADSGLVTMAAAPPVAASAPPRPPGRRRGRRE